MNNRLLALLVGIFFSTNLSCQVIQYVGSQSADRTEEVTRLHDEKTGLTVYICFSSHRFAAVVPTVTICSYSDEFHFATRGSGWLTADCIRDHMDEIQSMDRALSTSDAQQLYTSLQARFEQGVDGIDLEPSEELLAVIKEHIKIRNRHVNQLKAAVLWKALTQRDSQQKPS